MNKMKMSVKNAIYQSNPINKIIEEGLVQGTVPIGQVKARGNFGIGAPTGLTGELVFLDGVAHYFSPEGVSGKLSDEDLVLFAVVTNFQSKDVISLKKELPYAGLLDFLSATFGTTDIPQAIKVRGRFREVTYRCLTGGAYKQTGSTNAHENRFTAREIDGSVVGFFFPDLLSGITVSGFHFHFIDDSESRGGHLYDAQPLDVEVTIQPASEFVLGFPEET